MSDEEAKDKTPTEEIEEVIDDSEEEVQRTLKSDKDEAVKLSHLEALRDEFKAHVDKLQRDHAKSEEERNKLHGHIEKLNETIEELTKKLEDKGEKHDDSTVVIPPAELDPPINPKPDDGTEEHQTPSHSESKKRRLHWW
jgi:predicted nuclease with TOPRIM domain